MKTIYFLQYKDFQYVTTDVTVMAEFCIFLGCLGNCETRGESEVEIPLSRINPNLHDIFERMLKRVSA
jgi:hypothetical protein